MMKIEYLEIEQVIAIHDTLIEEFGGSFGIRDLGLVESVVSQPQQAFADQDLYPSLFDKAAAYAFFMSESQAFIDGNKRTATTIAGVFLDINGYELDCVEGELFEMVMKLANKRLTREKLSEWFKKKCKKK